MKEKFIAKRKYFSLTKSKKEIQSFVMEFILVLVIAANSEPKMFFSEDCIFVGYRELLKCHLWNYEDG